MLIRALLIWLLVLAVPAQGAAAATMVSCGPNHHGGVPAAHTQQVTTAAHAHHGTDAQVAHEHHDTSALAGQVEQETASSTSPESSKAAATAARGGHSDKQKCSACASCCSVGAILNTVRTIPAPAATPTVFSAVVPTVEAFAVGGPDRPPRIVLA